MAAAAGGGWSRPETLGRTTLFPGHDAPGFVGLHLAGFLQHSSALVLARIKMSQIETQIKLQLVVIRFHVRA